MSEAKKCPWGVPAAPIEEAPSLSEVMSEQLADDLVHKQESRERIQQEEDQVWVIETNSLTEQESFCQLPARIKKHIGHVRK